MDIAIGSDHAGFHLKSRLRDLLRAEGHNVIDVGATSTEPSDYPDYAESVARTVADGKAQRGIMVCGTGAGSCMAANKVDGVRAAMVFDPVTARLTREHNDANVLCLGERISGVEMVEEIVRVFIGTPFSGSERHIRRIAKIAAIEAG